MNKIEYIDPNKVFKIKIIDIHINSYFKYYDVYSKKKKHLFSKRELIYNCFVENDWGSEQVVSEEYILSMSNAYNEKSYVIYDQKVYYRSEVQIQFIKSDSIIKKFDSIIEAESWVDNFMFENGIDKFVKVK